jgi:hypothetical protein
MLPFRAAPRRGPHLLMGRLMAVQAFWQSQNLGAGRIHSAQADEIGSPDTRCVSGRSCIGARLATRISKNGIKRHPSSLDGRLFCFFQELSEVCAVRG